MTTDANAFLMGAGGRSATFHAVGDQIDGWILALDTRQQTKFETQEPMFWEDGKPRLQLVVTAQTQNTEDDDDDGVRRIYAKGQMLQAIRQAVTKAGAKGLAVDGRLFIRYVGNDEPKRKGMNGAKRYFAKYLPPTPQVTPVPDDGPNETPVPDEDDVPF